MDKPNKCLPLRIVAEATTSPVDPAEVERRGAEQAAHTALFNKFDSWAERYARAHSDERENLLAEG
jgi:hypothetical protein